MIHKSAYSIVALASVIFLNINYKNSARAQQASISSLESLLSINQANTGTCTGARHRQLQDNVDKLCKSSGAKSCRSDKNSGMTKAEALENAQKFEACAAARDAINKECYGGGDAGHINAANEARAAAKTCRAVP